MATKAERVQVKEQRPKTVAKRPQTAESPSFQTAQKTHGQVRGPVKGQATTTVRQPAPKKSGDAYSVELDHGHRGKYLIHFKKPQNEAEVLSAFFQDGKVPAGYKLENQGVDLLGWTWRLSVPGGNIDIGTFQKLTPDFQKHFGSGVVALTSEETASYRARQDAFLDSKPTYLGGQSVREAFKECRDNKIGESQCWGKRAGFYYYIGWQTGQGTVLEVKDAPHTPEVIRNWEWYLNRGYSLNDAAFLEEEWQTFKLRMVIFSFASALAAAPGAVRKPTIPPSAPAQAGQALATLGQAYGAWKTALGKDLTTTDMTLMAIAGALGAAANLLQNMKLPRAKVVSTTPSEPASPPPSVAGSKSQAHWRDTPPVSKNPAGGLKPGEREVTDLGQYSKQKAAAAEEARQAQQAAKTAVEANAVDAQGRIAVGQTGAPTTGGATTVSAGGGKSKGPTTVGSVSSTSSSSTSRQSGTSRTGPTSKANLIPERYPLLPRTDVSNEVALDFYKANLSKYPPEIQGMIKNIPTVGRVKTVQKAQLAKIDRAIRALHTEEGNVRIAPRSAEHPLEQSKRAGQNEGEQFAAALTGNKTLNITGKTKSGELVEFDSVRLIEHRLIEIKMNLSPYKTSGDVMDQMRRQATFAKDWGFSEVRWEVYDHESYLTAKYAHDQLSELNPKLGARITVENPSASH